VVRETVARMHREAKDALRDAAARALEEDAGCKPERARALVDAVARAAADEALEVIAGRAPSYGGVVDHRVAMLDRVLRALPREERFPDRYEVGAMFRITPGQAANALRTYQARFSDAYRARLQAALATVSPKGQTRAGTSVFVFEFDDPAVLDYAVERLRRRGLTRSVSVDRTKLELVVDREQKDRFGRTAAEALKEG
jgi:hypothetical protein